MGFLPKYEKISLADSQYFQAQIELFSASITQLFTHDVSGTSNLN